jgi:hypothetical protein
MMEDDEEEVCPDENGNFVAKHFGWTIIDASIWAFVPEKIISLDVSFNLLETLPWQIGSLLFLKDLNCSCNQLTILPAEIGKLHQLECLKANGNKLCTIPLEIGECQNMRNVVLSENQITSLPISLASCSKLEVLKLQHNKLQQIPVELALRKDSIKEINISRNPNMVLVPKSYRDKTEAIMGILCIHYDHNKKINSIEADTLELKCLSQHVENKVKMMPRVMDTLEIERGQLMRYQHSARYFISYQNLVRAWKERIQNLRDPYPNLRGPYPLPDSTNHQDKLLMAPDTL